MKAVARTVSLFPTALVNFAVLSLIIVSVICYVFFIEQAVFSTASRTKLERAMSALSSDVGDLEANYIAAQNAVTLETARSYGLEEVANPEFISAKGLGVLSFND